MLRFQETIPPEYHQLTVDAMQEKIRRHKEKFGKSLSILCHHYQSDHIAAVADHLGDSLKLSQLAASQKEAKYIIFCGVHFMAESADVLSSSDQVVCLPNLYAGCTMADMADATDVTVALEEIRRLTSEKVVPVTYVNSSADVKAITARAGGSCCTSSNARNVFEWALRKTSLGGAGGGKVFAIPDQHLGRNIAYSMGYSADDCVVYDYCLPNGGVTGEEIRHATFILWKGHCYVHQLFRPEHVHKVRARHDGIKVIVHPECPHEVVELSDAAGSTEQIIRAVETSPDGTKWAVGTESNLVNRLARRNHSHFVRILSDSPSICALMARVDLPHLLWVLDNLAAGRIVNQIRVDAGTSTDAKIALERMIEIKAALEATRTGAY